MNTSPGTDPGIVSPVVLFDGICHLCNRSVTCLLKHDKKKKLRFAPLSSTFASGVLDKYPRMNDSDSIVLIYKGKVYLRSDAILRIVRIIGGVHAFLYVFILVPPFIRNRLYDWVAANRYRWFGKRDHCMLPDPDVADRFLS